MGKKITRRAVLGMAIAGFTATPFAIHTVAQVKELTENPDAVADKLLSSSSASSQFFEKWNGLRQQFLTPSPVEKSESKTVTLKYDLSTPRHCKFQRLNTNVIGTAATPDDYIATGGKGMFYEITEGTINVEKNEYNVNISKNDQYFTYGKRNYDPPMVGMITYVLRDDVNGTDIPLLYPKKLLKPDSPDFERQSLIGSWLQPILTNPFVTSDWSVGDRFIVPAQRLLAQGTCFCFTVDSFTLKTLKMIGNKTVAEIVAEQSFDSPDQLRSYSQILLQKYLDATFPKDSNHLDHRKQSEKSFNSLIDQTLEQWKNYYRTQKWYVDLESGLVIRYESYRKNLNPNSVSQWELFQMIES
jgi:hypothetical protein